ncbi:MAG: hypothetical protein P4L16_07645 [Chlamydiales bacterium]|nr:hypothetical protein [Chlamydiales bacterium]
MQTIYEFYNGMTNDAKSIWENANGATFWRSKNSEAQSEQYQKILDIGTRILKGALVVVSVHSALSALGLTITFSLGGITLLALTTLGCIAIYDAITLDKPADNDTPTLFQRTVHVIAKIDEGADLLDRMTKTFARIKMIMELLLKLSGK